MQKTISKKEIDKAIRQFSSKAGIVSVTPYSTGNINRIFEIKLKNKKELILRLFNEDWKAEKEFFVYSLIAKNSDIPIPEAYFTDTSKKILPSAYSIMSKIRGEKIDINYLKYKNKNLFQEAGEILAKLHEIKFSSFGWIMESGVKPKFKTWKEFALNDIYSKLKKIEKISEVKKLSGRINSFIENNSRILEIKEIPSLLHKDYHCSHIITDKNHVTGIIDVEWAIAGHNENDFTKLESWAFQKIKDIRDSFFKGYLKYGEISPAYIERKKFYELWHLISMINISQEIKKNTWLRPNIADLNKFLKEN
jgi:aminoglycoside phosphotransferase (APT) family kinase protein